MTLLKRAFHLQSRESRIRGKALSRDRGSVFVELLWTIPAFCAALSLVVLTGVIVNARSALQDSVTMALSLATTRGNGFAGGPGTIDAIERFVTGHADLTFSELRRLIVSPNLPQDLSLDVVSEQYCHTFYHPDASTTCSGTGPLQTHRPIVQLYALAYVSQAMRMHSLGAARFPCASDSLETPGCLICRFIPGIEPALASGLVDRGNNQGTISPPAQASDPIFLAASSPAERVALARRRLTLACRYKVDHPAIAAIAAISSLVGADFGHVFDVSAVASIDSR